MTLTNPLLASKLHVSPLEVPRSCSQPRYHGDFGRDKEAVDEDPFNIISWQQLVGLAEVPQAEMGE